MKYREKYLHCGDNLLKSQQNEIDEILKVIQAIEWKDEFQLQDKNEQIYHQRAYNKAFEIEFIKYNWEIQPK